MPKFHVILTPCFPASWKVESVQWPGCNSSSSEYFRDRQEAEAEAARRNRMAR